MKPITIERWVRLAFCNFKYAVSNFGRVKSCYTVSRSGVIKLKDHILKPNINKNGYYILSFTWVDKGIRVDKTVKIHRLVAQSFLPNIANKPEVNHRDLNKLNNHFKNLEWTDGLGNMKHFYSSEKCKVKNIHNISEEEVSLIKESVIEYGLETTAIKFNISISLVSRINGKVGFYRGSYKPIIDLQTGIFYTSKELAILKNTTKKEICRLLNEERKPNTTQYRYA